MTLAQRPSLAIRISLQLPLVDVNIRYLEQRHVLRLSRAATGGSRASKKAGALMPDKLTLSFPLYPGYPNPPDRRNNPGSVDSTAGRHPACMTCLMRHEGRRLCGSTAAPGERLRESEANLHS